MIVNRPTPLLQPKSKNETPIYKYANGVPVSTQSENPLMRRHQLQVEQITDTKGRTWDVSHLHYWLPRDEAYLSKPHFERIDVVLRGELTHWVANKNNGIAYKVIEVSF